MAKVCKISKEELGRIFSGRVESKESRQARVYCKNYGSGETRE
jgi:hypothetical protein